MAIKLLLDPVVLKSTILDNGITRTPTRGERIEITRLMHSIEKGYCDSNVSDVFVSPEMTHHDFLLLLSSGCPEVVELAILLQGLQGEWKIYPDQEASLLVGILATEPRLFHLLLQAKGWNYQDDTQNTLKTLGIRYRWKRHPRKKTRHKGYRDHGVLRDEQQKLRTLCLSDFYVEQFEDLRRYDQQTKDTLEFLVGMIS